MDKAQIKTMAMFGYSITEIPGKTIPKATYYKRDQEGHVIAMPNLPADSHNMHRYLSRGFVLDPEKLKIEPLLESTLVEDSVVESSPAEPQESKPAGFTCETCGKVFTYKVALIGHNRSHKPK